MNEIRVVSTFFVESYKDDTSDQFLLLIEELNERLEHFKAPRPPVDCIYNPTIYARHTFEMYVRRYCNSQKPIMYFGMNPGPFGMSQTGIPFGEVEHVKNWLKIIGPVGKPLREVKSRIVKGFDCERSEISGKRFWGLWKDICGVPENFFKTSFIYNYLPQQWLKENGCNVTPNDFKTSEMKPLFDICDPIFIKVLELYKVEIIVAIGKFCEGRAQRALKEYMPRNNIKIFYLPHPSPRSVNNTNWSSQAKEYLEKYDLLKYYKEAPETSGLT